MSLVTATTRYSPRITNRSSHFQFPALSGFHELARYVEPLSRAPQGTSNVARPSQHWLRTDEWSEYPTGVSRWAGTGTLLRRSRPTLRLTRGTLSWTAIHWEYRTVIVVVTVHIEVVTIDIVTILVCSGSINKRFCWGNKVIFSVLCRIARLGYERWIILWSCNI